MFCYNLYVFFNDRLNQFKFSRFHALVLNHLDWVNCEFGNCSTLLNMYVNWKGFI